MDHNVFQNGCHILLEKYKSKLQWGTTPQGSEWPSSKNPQTINAGEDVDKRKPPCTISRSVNWNSHYGKQHGGFLKTKHRTTIWPSNPMTELYTQRKPQCSLQHCLQKPGCGSNLNAHHRGMDKEDVVHIHNGILLSHKKEWTGSFVEMQMYLESVIQREGSQKEKNKYHTLMHIYIYIQNL